MGFDFCASVRVGSEESRTCNISAEALRPSSASRLLCISMVDYDFFPILFFFCWGIIGIE